VGRVMPVLHAHAHAARDREVRERVVVSTARRQGKAMLLTADARAALRAAGLSPRASRPPSAVLTGALRAASPIAARAAFAQAPRAADAQLDAWLAIAADGGVTAYTGKCELGQGLHNSQIQLVAEELGVAVDRVRLVQCDTALVPDQGTTSGSQSHPTNFN